MKQKVSTILLVFALLIPAAVFGAEPAAVQNPVSSAHSAAKAAAQPDQPSFMQPQSYEAITGQVVQTMKGGGYSYVLLKKKNGDKIWLAAPETDVESGDQVTFKGGMEMVNFQSKALNRTFDKIIFSDGLTDKGKDAKKTEKKSPGAKGAVIKADEKIKVDKATGPNAYRIAEIYKLKAKLDKKKVVVKAKVVKVSANIMDRNWVHLQDGSGDPKKGTADLVVTSKTLPAVGDVVIASGVLEKDKDFGGGYRYDVIVEKAEISIK